MKEIPILFSTAMVQAILQDLKTKSRRVIKPQPKIFGDVFKDASQCYKKEGALLKWVEGAETKSRWQPGDRLWVRETCCAHELSDGRDGVLYKADSAFIEIADTQEAVDKWMDLRYYGKKEYRDVPSIHMPKWCSRIWLEVVSVRVERLQNISREDAVAEGIGRWVEERMKSKPTHYEVYYREPGDDSTYSSCPIVSYESLWRQINGPDSWNENPWVWVIEFKVLSTTGKP